MLVPNVFLVRLTELHFVYVTVVTTRRLLTGQLLPIQKLCKSFHCELQYLDSL